MKFYDVTVQYIMELEDHKGKIKEKKISEKSLVKARSCQNASNVIKEIYDKMINNYNIKSVKETKYVAVISDKENTKDDESKNLIKQMLGDNNESQSQ